MWVAVFIGVTLLLLGVRHRLNQTYVALAYLLVVQGASARAGRMFGIAVAATAFVCFDFFFMTGQLYADQEAPPDLRVTAQGFLTFVTYGIGMFLGSTLSGVALDYFTTTVGGTAHHNWQSFWLSSAAGSFAILLLVAAFF